MNWKIQPASANDAPKLSRITKLSKAHWGYSEEQMAAWDEDLTVTEQYIDENYVFKCHVDDYLVAYYSLVDVGDDKIKLDNLFVHPEYMKQGLGSLLLGEAINAMQKLEFKVMVLESDPNAEGFYSHHGFQKIGEIATSIPGRFMPVMALSI